MALLEIGLALALLSGSDGHAIAAKSLAAKARREYIKGNYAESERDLLAAFRLQQVPTLLFNLGQCERAQGHLEQAIPFYSSYLEADPHAPNVAVAIHRLQEALAAVGETVPVGAATLPLSALGATAPPASTSARDDGYYDPVESASVGPRRSHWVGASFAIAAVVCASFAVVGAVRVGDYLQTRAVGPYENANNWGTAAILLGTAAAGGTAGAILTW